MGCDMVVLCPIHEGTLSEVRGEGTLPGVEWEMRTQTAVIRAITGKRRKGNNGMIHVQAKMPIIIAFGQPA